MKNLNRQKSDQNRNQSTLETPIYFFKHPMWFLLLIFFSFTEEPSSDELFTEEELDHKRLEIIWKDISTVHVTITFAQQNPWCKEWFQKFIFGFYRSNILRVKADSFAWWFRWNWMFLLFLHEMIPERLLVIFPSLCDLTSINIIKLVV